MITYGQIIVCSHEIDLQVIFPALPVWKQPVDPILDLRRSGLVSPQTVTEVEVVCQSYVGWEPWVRWWQQLDTRLEITLTMKPLPTRRLRDIWTISSCTILSRSPSFIIFIWWRCFPKSFLVLSAHTSRNLLPAAVHKTRDNNRKWSVVLCSTILLFQRQQHGMNSRTNNSYNHAAVGVRGKGKVGVKMPATGQSSTHAQGRETANWFVHT